MYGHVSRILSKIPRAYRPSVLSLKKNSVRPKHDPSPGQEYTRIYHFEHFGGEATAGIVSRVSPSVSCPCRGGAGAAATLLLFSASPSARFINRYMASSSTSNCRCSGSLSGSRSTACSSAGRRPACAPSTAPPPAGRAEEERAERGAERGAGTEERFTSTFIRVSVISSSTRAAPSAGCPQNRQGGGGGRGQWSSIDGMCRQLTLLPRIMICVLSALTSRHLSHSGGRRSLCLFRRR